MKKEEVSNEIREKGEKIVDLGLKGKIAIITGGASGIGASIVDGFVKEGANVVIADVSLDASKKFAKKRGRDEVKVVVVKTDVTKKSDADNLVSSTMKEFGKIDILVNNAGVCSNIMLVNLEEKEWDRVNNVNTKGIYLVTRAVVPQMISARYGKVVNVASVAGKVGIEGLTHYSASKFGVIGFTQALAREVAEYNLNVNAVCPGFVWTPIWEKGLLDDLSKRMGLPWKEAFDYSAGQAPLKRPQTVDDIANVVLFLGSEVSKNITGEAISVNGGWRMD